MRTKCVLLASLVGRNLKKTLIKTEVYLRYQKRGCISHNSVILHVCVSMLNNTATRCFRYSYF